MTDFLTSPLGFGADDSPRSSYTLHVNGVERPVADAWIGESLLYVLRERLGLAGAKGGCEQGECGACSVQVDGQLTAACLVPAALAAGVEIRTVEGLAEEGVPSDVQQALADSGAVQCGYCAPGLAMAVHDLLERNHHPSELEARQALCGNLCRCTGYRGALAAVQAVAASRADDEDAPEEESTATPFFGDGPADALIEATSPVEELIPLPAAAGHDEAELDPYEPYESYESYEQSPQGEDDGYDVEAELPVYVDVPPQHGGYDGGYPAPGYPQQDGYPQPEAYPQQGYATGTYDQPHDQPHEQPYGGGQGPYPGGPFGGRFPSQADGSDVRSAAGEAGGTLLMTAPGGTQEMPVVGGAAAGPATGEFHLTPDHATGEFATGQFATGQFATGQFATGQFATGEFATGEFPTGEFATGQFPAGEFATGYAVADHSGTDHGQQDYPAGAYSGATVPEQAVAEPAGAAGAASAGRVSGQTGELRLGSGLGAGLGAGMRAQAAARRRGAVDQADPTPSPAPVPSAATSGGSFAGAATSAAGLPSDVTGSFHVGTISMPVVSGPEADGFDAGQVADQPYEYGRASGVPGGLDPATGVYVLPHQHGQESGS
ncbi:Aerobic-type carbon monoxide dehydrogenase, small subunit, CoxS/CutS family [Streptacidiphilus jiangxiensis]|uniref:Aerobic-type carbon monoxide dehydrogenase, small subunit, CoxS/CutS family n=1 Tax=Streptacidiphilus jiangxiensis TaxID=235985 RepID=A0A1H7RMV9_STRJI|nr:Aerobic-type carbon monoxide dehydrogenase, small subunit, CoxS/CutS family [Streptacidiphilus jiangxiensis]